MGWSAINRLGAVVGLLTGIATVIGLIVSGWAVVWASVLPIAGWTLCIGATLTYVIALYLHLLWPTWARGKAQRRREVVRAAGGLSVLGVIASPLLLFALLAAVVIAGGVDELVPLGRVIALGSVPWSVTLGVIYVRWTYRQRQAEYKECPDCAETVKVKARVCRYCGYRWSEY